MKRFFVFLSLFILTSCLFYQKLPIYEKSYISREMAIEDIYWWMDGYKADSIPLEDWITYNSYTNDGYLIERVYHKKWDEKTEIVLTFTTCMCDSTTYHLSVVMRTKDKNQKQF